MATDDNAARRGTGPREPSLIQTDGPQVIITLRRS